MTECILVQTCDRYSHLWDGFWHFMEKQWDFSIKAPIYFASNSLTARLPKWCKGISFGDRTFVEGLKESLRSIEEDSIFLMLEDYWPIAPMTKNTFESLRLEFEKSGVDALQVSNYSPYYALRTSGRKVAGRELMTFLPKSEWIFNFQARLWRRGSLEECLSEPKISEAAVGSAITAEIASDEAARRKEGFSASLVPYTWYPISGVSHRGRMSAFGEALQNIVETENYFDRLVSPPASCRIDRARQVCSG